jgi:predicted phosphoribosyltransferase
MYFKSRAEAGVMLASQLMGYRYENTVIVALSDGAVQVAMQIASELHATLTMMLMEPIEVPGEGEVFGNLDQDGKFIYNGMFSTGQIEEYYTEFHGYLEDKKREKMGIINKLLGSGGIVDETILREHNVILVADGLPNGSSLETAMEYLKPLQVLRVILATPIASVAAVDRAHLLADELHILGVTDNYLDTNHYYDVNDVPDRDTTLQLLNDFVLRWR